jgi:hypothetical protein
LAELLLQAYNRSTVQDKLLNQNYALLAYAIIKYLVLCTVPRTDGPLLLRPRFIENSLGYDRGVGDEKKKGAFWTLS